jgi:hypothetical protein
MRRVSVKMLLLSWAALLLAIDGCWTGPGAGRGGRQVAAGDEGDKEEHREKGPPFHLPDDQAGRLLGQVLPPTARPRPLHGAAPAPPVVPWPRLPEPRLALPGSESVVARLPQPKRKDQIQPRLVVEEGLGEWEEPRLPERPSFTVGRRTAVPSPDAGLPPPLPVMATPVPDRVPLDDATVEASAAAVLSAPLPRRDTPVPFSRVRVPEPFPNRLPLSTRLPEEETTPVVDVPAAPGR